MNTIPLTTGRVVRSMAGRDAGRLFVVIGEIDQDFVLIADGGLRKLERPKKKRRKHLKATREMIADLQNDLQDHRIRKLLSAAMPHEEG